MHHIQTMAPESKAKEELLQLGADRYQLGLSGRFDPGWAGSLSNGLARRRVNILRVEAFRGMGMHWDSRIDLNFYGSTIKPDQISFRTICIEAAFPTPVDDIRLDDYQLERSTRHGGSLYLEVTGPDQIGCLSALLNTFSLFSLFPAEMLVETNNKRIFDRFWLKGLGSSTPSLVAAEGLKIRMNDLMHN